MVTRHRILSRDSRVGTTLHVSIIYSGSERVINRPNTLTILKIFLIDTCREKSRDADHGTVHVLYISPP